MKNFTLWHFSTSTFLLRCFKTFNFTFVRFFLAFAVTAGSICFYPSAVYGQALARNTSTPGDQQLSPELEKTVRNTLKQSSLKLQLIENNGQLGLPEKVVAYFSSGNQTVFIERDRLLVIVVQSLEKEKENGIVNDKSSIAAKSLDYRYNAFTILFKGSQGFNAYQKIKLFPTKRNFINASSPETAVTNVSSYGEVVLKNMYPGIDLRLYSQESGQMEFDWIIAPGVDAGLIKMKFEGQKKLTIGKSGDLQITLGLGSFNIHLPESYYVTPSGKLPVPVSFCFSGNNEVVFKGFEKGSKKYPLVIDPDLLWGTFFDGGNFGFDEYFYGLEFNVNNNLLYCSGAANKQVSNTYAAAISSGYEGTFKSAPDALVYALTKDGQTVQYITYLGGTSEDAGIGISVNQSFVFVSGYTNSADFPVTKSVNGDVEAFDTVYHGIDQGFVAIFNLSLDDLIYCSYLGGPGKERALTIRAGADSSYYVSLTCGDTLSRTGVDYLASSADSTFDGTTDGWIGEFTSMNTIRFGTYIGGNGTDLVNDFQVLSDGDVVFVGNTLGIAEINASVPDGGSGRDALFGRINVPASGPVTFDIIEKIGGNGADFGWGIYSLSDSVSILVGQTNSPDFPLGSAPAFQNTSNGDYDGFVARINNDGSGGYQSSFVGGSGEDILVSVRPVIINNWPVLLAFGTTKSNDLATKDITGGTFYSNVNSGGYDMMWLICNLNLTYKYYLSYIGGSNNDYLGQTAAPLGSNHLFYNSSDSVIYLGTTTHSDETTHAPLFVGRGATDLVNAGVPVFDSVKSNSNNDTHVIIAISVRMLFIVLPVTWEDFQASVLSDCSVALSWRTSNESGVSHYAVERSFDGRNYERVATLPAYGNSFSYNDNDVSQREGKAEYRLLAEDNDGKRTYSNIISVQLCKQKEVQTIKVYPTVATNYFVVSGHYAPQVKKIMVEVLDAGGRSVLVRQLAVVTGAQTFYFERRPAPGSYFVIIRNGETSELLHTQKMAINL